GREAVEGDVELGARDDRPRPDDRCDARAQPERPNAGQTQRGTRDCEQGRQPLAGVGGSIGEESGDATNSGESDAGEDKLFAHGAPRPVREDTWASGETAVSMATGSPLPARTRATENGMFSHGVRQVKVLTL